MKRANIVKEVKIIHVTVSALLFFSGLFLCIWPDIGGLAARWLVGANFIVTGLVRLLGYFSNDLYRLAFQYDFALGGFAAILGVLIFLYPDKVTELLPYVLGTYVMLDGLFKLQTAFDARQFGMKKWVGLLASSIAVCICGIVVLIGATDWDRVILTGLVLMVDAAENIWNTMGTVRVRAKDKERFEDLL
ncbi:MAG: DUF308 domain-containing protein [Ruminococcaceae bacterium]|nr:DUF308 domain-containing protein [Oscillospiraceae bacterium]